MSDRQPQNGAEALDHEISVKGIVGFAVGLVALMVVAAVAMWWLSDGLRSRLTAADPPPPMLPEARRPYEPPAPRLQADPNGEMAELAAAQAAELASWGWVDETAGIARIPIERAMELAASGARAAPPAAPAEEDAP